MSLNIFGKYFRLTFLFVFLLEVLSVYGHLLPLINYVCFFVILLVMLILTMQKLEYGLYMVAAELIVGSYGYLFSYSFGGGKISLRIGMFLIIMSVWLFRWVKRRDFSILKSRYFGFLVALGLLMFVGLLNAYFSGINFSNIFFDFNGYLFGVLVFPFYYVGKNLSFFSDLLSVMLGAVFASAVKVFFLFYVFAHDSRFIAPEIYKWVRDTRVAEVTKMKDHFFRIFLQSQIYTLMLFFVVFSLLFIGYMVNERHLKNKFDKNMIYLGGMLVLLFTSILVGFSRTFWVGGIAAGGCFMVLFVLCCRCKKHTLLKLLSLWAVLTAAGLLFMNILLMLPVRFQSGQFDSFDLVRSRAGALSSEDAIDSRWNMLFPLFESILEAPYFGHGFGAQVTYKSSDPRIVAASPGNSGQYTTFTFEWGYLDMWLKFGLIGLALIVVFVGKLLWDGYCLLRMGMKKLNRTGFMPMEFILAIGFLFGFISLVVCHGFSPYLNHPLGISYLIITALYWDVLYDMIRK